MKNIKNGYALDMSKLVNQLRVKAGVMEMGERIAWGSDTSLMREAADKIEELENRNKAMLQELIECSYELQCLCDHPTCESCQRYGQLAEFIEEMKKAV